MRALAVAALAVFAPSLAAAEAPRLLGKDVIWGAPHVAKQAKPGTAPFTSISHTIYLNSCLPNGCDLTFGNIDDSRTNTSTIAEGNVHLAPYGYGDAAWQSLVQCVRDTYSPFDITIVTDDPGNVPHSEIMVAGLPQQLNSQLVGAGGVAPFLGCGATDDNVITFMFAGLTSDENYLCGGVAQETSHAFGLDHELDAKDPLTYLDLGSRKAFQDSNPRCGEELSQPRDCTCGGSTQNTYQYLMDHFGPANLAPASVAISSPKDGGWVLPGFPVRLKIDDQLSLVNASMTVDGAASGALTEGPFTFNAPTTIAPGPHTVDVRVQDFADRTLTASAQVTVIGPCDANGACAAGLHCLGNQCLPGANVDGGLGATCAVNEDCITGACASDGTNSYCTGVCDADGTCPGGYQCLQTGAAPVCWPSPDDGGGCSTSGDRGTLVMLLGLGAALTLRRKRA